MSDKAPSRALLKDIPSISNDILEDCEEVLIGHGLIRAVLKTMRQHSGATYYSPDELYAVEGPVTKIWFPVPWYSAEIGAFQLMEIVIIQAADELTKENKHALRKLAAKVNFPDPRRIYPDNTTYIFYRKAADVRVAHGEKTCYLIQRGPEAGYLFFKFISNALAGFINMLEEKLPETYKTTQAVIDFDKDLITRLLELKEEEKRKLNQRGRETRKSLIMEGVR